MTGPNRKFIFVVRRSSSSSPSQNRVRSVAPAKEAVAVAVAEPIMAVPVTTEVASIASEVAMPIASKAAAVEEPSISFGVSNSIRLSLCLSLAIEAPEMTITAKMPQSKAIASEVAMSVASKAAAVEEPGISFGVSNSISIRLSLCLSCQRSGHDDHDHNHQNTSVQSHNLQSGDVHSLQSCGRGGAQHQLRHQRQHQHEQPR